jgi:hypothetical protein
MPSSVISAMQYDPFKQKLRVVFVSGVVYDYEKVPEKVFKAMRSSGSKGKFLNTQIKGNYRFKKVS